eukprot:Rmarinus@m.22911
MILPFPHSVGIFSCCHISLKSAVSECIIASPPAFSSSLGIWSGPGAFLVGSELMTHSISSIENGRLSSAGPSSCDSHIPSTAASIVARKTSSAWVGGFGEARPAK